MISEHETIVRRKVNICIILEIRRDEKSASVAHRDHHLLRL